MLSFSWGVANSGGLEFGSGGGAGKATFQGLTIVHNIDKATPKLLEACATGTHLKDATITHRKAGKGQQEFLIVKMNDVIITAVPMAAHGAAGVGDGDVWRLPRSISSTSRKSPTARSMRASTSSTTSRPTKWARPARRRTRTQAAMEQSDTPPRELTLEEAVALAILLQKSGQLVEAGELYRRVLEMHPNHPQALHYAGVLAHQQGRNEEAVALVERSLALEPDQADWYSNHGIILQSHGRLDERSTPTATRSPSTRRTRMRTATSACC